MDKHFRIDSELLISAIKRHECLWNKDLKEYHKKAKKEASWNQICAELIEDFESHSDQDKTIKQLMVKKRWNNIRDYYKKDLAMQLSGSIGQPSMKRRKYMFSNKLEFLRPHYGIIYTTAKTSDDDQENDGDDTEEKIEVYLNSDSEDSFTPRKKQKAKVKQEGNNYSLPVSWTQNTSGASSSAQETSEEKANVTTEDEDDSDLLFLKSLLPDMKALKRREKIEFKLGILQLYKNIISPQEEDPFENENEDRKFQLS